MWSANYLAMCILNLAVSYRIVLCIVISVLRPGGVIKDRELILWNCDYSQQTSLNSTTSLITNSILFSHVPYVKETAGDKKVLKLVLYSQLEINRACLPRSV